MFAQLKRKLYFPIARYFCFFAAARLNHWKPRIIVITGSNGKTTLLHLLESQIGEKAKYSHHANSSYGIPFDILDLHRKSLLKSEWVSLFLKAPIQVLKPLPKQKIYIVEADCDRPGEGKFLSEFLRPEVVLWVSVSRTHALQFDPLIVQKKFKSVDDAIAYEFGFFLENCGELAVINGDLPPEVQQSVRSKAAIKIVTKKGYLQGYSVNKNGSEFHIEQNKYSFKTLLPEEVFYSIAMCKETVKYLDLSFDHTFSEMQSPPGRGSVFEGIKGITIIDSSYNANLSSMKSIIEMYRKYRGNKKWVVIGDMLEQGKGEKSQHEKLAELLYSDEYEKIILMGPRVCKYTYPKLLSLREVRHLAGDEAIPSREIDRHEIAASSFRTPRNDTVIAKFEGPKEALDYLLNHITGGETILFKGARFMEGIIEHLLKNKDDVSKLCRREKIWEIRRREWGL